MYNFKNLNKYSFTYQCNNGIDLRDYVFFIENSNQAELVFYIKSNYSEIQQRFIAKGKRFVLLSAIEYNHNLASLLTYYYPKVAQSKIIVSSILQKKEVIPLGFKYLKTYLNYSGQINTGLLSIDYQSEFIEFDFLSVNSFKQFITDFLETIIIDEVDYLPSSYEDYSDANIKLDEETEHIVNSILEQFEDLRNKGELLQILPIVEKYLKTQNTVSIDDLSTLRVDDDFNIFLTDYNNLEIKLSHLTKCLYLLFLNNPKGILLSDLVSYRNQLLEYYKCISNREDYSKMQESIDDIVSANSNAVYVHLSRIKSAFTKVIHPRIAEHYFIDGGKTMPKKIKLNKSLISWESQIINNDEIDF